MPVKDGGNADDIIDDVCNLHLGIKNEKIKLTKRELI